MTNLCLLASAKLGEHDRDALPFRVSDGTKAVSRITANKQPWDIRNDETQYGAT